MKEYIFRIHPGMDLKREIEKRVNQENIKAGCILSIVGSLKQANLRLADGKTEKKMVENFEIVSATGTVSIKGCHIHLGLARKKGIVIGGHLKENSFINTTAEIVILEFENLEFSRELDKSTGYKELIIKEK